MVYKIKQKSRKVQYVLPKDKSLYYLLSKLKKTANDVDQ
jgi:hypothetical protein